MRLLVPAPITDTTLLSSSVPEDDAPVWSSVATYAAGDLVLLTDTHQVYESLRAANTNRNPRTAAEWWVSRGPTKRWAMFDGSGSTATTAAGSVIVDIQATAAEDITFVDLVADTVILSWGGTTVTRTPPAPVAPASSVTYSITNLGFSGGTLRIQVQRGSGDVSIGNVVFGNTLTLGSTEHGATVGIIDYSRKRTDEFGNVSVVRGSYSRRVTARVMVRADEVDTVAAVLAAVRGTPCAWDVSPRHQAFDVFGYYTDWSLVIAYPRHSIYSITLESIYQTGLEVAPGASVLPPPEEPVNTLSLLHFDSITLPDEVTTNTVDTSESAHSMATTSVFAGQGVTGNVYAVCAGSADDGRLITGATGFTAEAWVIPSATYNPGIDVFSLIKGGKATASEELYFSLQWLTGPTTSGLTVLRAECAATTNYLDYTGFYVEIPWTDFTLGHVALVVTTSSYALYWKGSRIASGSFSSAEYPSSLTWDAASYFEVRCSSGSTDFRTDEARLSNVSRYSGATITVPTAPFTVD